MSGEKYLVTSALPYANGPIHFGHIAGAYLPADVFVRYLRLKQQDVVYICGTDEHGVAITINAEKQGLSPQALVDKYHTVIKKTFDRFNIEFDNFSRTSLPVHRAISQQFFTKLLEQGFIKKQRDRQYYCEKDAMFLPDRYIVGRCPGCGYEKARGDECPSCGTWLNALEILQPACSICGSMPEERETEHWFLQLQDLQPELEKWIDSRNHWKGNVLSFVRGMLKQGLHARPVTRDLSWGVPVPLDEAEGKTLYVWFDAPIGYISSTIEWAQKQGKPESWKKYWQAEDCRLVHFIGKDNIPFHTIVFPAMLMGQKSGYVLPDNVPANEFYKLEGRKFSTSEGWYIDLDDFFSKYSSDSVRFAVISNVPENRDTEFSWKDFQMRNNSALADSLGNFINRTLIFAGRYFDGRVPASDLLSEADEALMERRRLAPGEVGELVEGYHFRRAADAFIALSREGNRYFDEKAPWKSRKEDPADCATTIWVCLQLTLTLGQIARLFIPESAEKIFSMLGISELAAGLDWNAAGVHNLSEGHPLGKPEVLFRKIEDSEIEAELAALAARAESAAPASARERIGGAEIEYDDFLKLELRTGVVLEVERKKGSRKMLKLKVDVGGVPRQVMGALGQDYTPEDLIGKSVTVVCNLKPRKIMGELSEGMLLAVEDSNGLHLLTPDGDTASGSKIA